MGFAAALFLLAGPAVGQVVLNEIMANNESAVPHGTGFPDYVELLNRSEQPVTLDGWSLSDDPATPRKFVFSGVNIPAGGRLLVWCAVLPSGSGVFTGFGLGATGDRVLLYDAQGLTPADQATFGLQAEDFSLGRIPDGVGAWTLNRPTPLSPNEEQPRALAPALRINEWMARPTSGEDWLELYNPDDLPAVLSGMVLTDGTSVPPPSRPIPELSFLAPRGFIQMFASDLQETDADHLDFRLGAGGETLSLFAADRSSLVDRITYGAQADGVSQGRAPDGGDNLAFFPGAATPGQPNVAADLRVVINEILSHTDPPLEDAIELHNPSAEPVDLSHWWLSDSLVEPRKYRIPAGTTIAPGGFAVFYNTQFGGGPTGFSLNSYEGDRVVLSAGNAAGELTGAQTAIRFGALKNGVSLGRIATSAGADWAPLAARTFGVDQPASLPQFRQGKGLTNAAPRVGPVVITELHFQPGSASGDEEFIELHNASASPVTLFDPVSPTNTWRIRDGVSFEFPFNVTIPGGGYALITGFDPQQTAAAEAFRARFGVPANVPLFGPFSGRLSDTGETIELQHPDQPEGLDSPDPGFVPFEMIERIHYAAAAPWPAGTAGSALQRKDATTYGNEPMNWFTAAPTPGRANQAAPADTDADGLPDDWETANGLNPSDPGDAATDADGDGANNLNEFLADTDPRDSLSVFRIVGVSTSVAEVEVTFNAVAGRTYAVEFRPTISPGTWQSLAQLPASDISGPRVIRVSPPEGEEGFLRVTTPGAP